MNVIIHHMLIKWAMYIQCNIVRHLRSHCCCGNAAIHSLNCCWCTGYFVLCILPCLP